MKGADPVDPRIVDETYAALLADAEVSGYHLNPDPDFVRGLIEGLMTNEARYGYRSCPCRLASGEKAEDLDIICPCDYRDADVKEYGACFCALYVSEEIRDGARPPCSIPERRPAPDKRNAVPKDPSGGESCPQSLSYPVWRCKVCGYLCAREGPPEPCPICKAGKERFERFI